MPSCPGSKCNGFFLLEDMPHDCMEDYKLACFKFILKDKGDDAKKENEFLTLLKNLRDERRIYIESNFPPAINYIIKVAFKAKLNSINKNRRKAALALIKASTKTCFNITCNGHLNEDMICIICETEFCKTCENRIDDKEVHTCSKEDILSLELLSESTVPCPGCGTSIHRMSGCDHMTCTICKTKFLYSTGLAGGGGNHRNDTTEIQHVEKLSTEYQHDIEDSETLKLLMRFEKMKKTPNAATLIKQLQTMYTENEENDTVKWASVIAIEYNKYLQSYYYNKYYTRFAIDIEKHIRNKDLTPFIMRAVISNLKS
jgi:hypothetical protein